MLHVCYLEAVKSVGVLAQDIAYYNRLPDDHADRSYHWLYNMVNHYLARTRKEAVTANIRRGLGPLLAPLNQTQRSGTVAAIENSTNKKEPKGKGKGKDKKKKESDDVGGGSWQKLPKKEMPCKYFFSNDPTTKCHRGDDCQFSHTKSDRPKQSPKGGAKGGNPNDKSKIICPSLVKSGKCQQGDGCPHSHSPKLLALKTTFPCRYVVNNETCPHGKSCKYSHVPEVIKGARQDKGKSKGKGDAKDGSVATPFVPASLDIDVART